MVSEAYTHLLSFKVRLQLHSSTAFRKIQIFVVFFLCLAAHRYVIEIRKRTFAVVGSCDVVYDTLERCNSIY